MLNDQPRFTVRKVTKGPLHHFFGYYDKCPWDINEEYLLGLEIPFMKRPPRPNDIATIGIVDIYNNYTFEPLAVSHAWNWQQGCMLQWLAGNSDGQIIYNDRQDGRYVAVIQNIHSGRKRVLPRPIYAISHDGKSALSINFARLQRLCPGYGYVGLEDRSSKELYPEDDGIYWMNIETGETKLIISLAQVVNFGDKRNRGDSEHYFNHLLFSPDDSRFIFLHRWKPRTRNNGSSISMGIPWEGLGCYLTIHLKPFLRHTKHKVENSAVGVPFLYLYNHLRVGNKSGFKTRMFTGKPDGSDIHSVIPHEVVSHFDWRNNNQIIAWVYRPNVGENFILLTDRSQDSSVIGDGILTRDGHCSYSPGGRWILTDTYPDKDNIREILLYDCNNLRVIEIGKFFSPPQLIDDFRCDLHPRWSREGLQICFDSAHEGNRQLYTIDISEIATSAV